MKSCKSACALGLYKYSCDKPGSDLFGRFYAAILSELESWGLTPTYIGAEGNGYSGKLTKIGGRTHDKLVKSHFTDITVLSIASNPSGSEEPAYDSLASASLSYIEGNRELLASVVVNESIIKVHSTQFQELVCSQVELCRWDFGYGFSSSIDNQPDFHILGLDNGKLSAEEYKSLSNWYATPGEVRRALLRDIYPYNLLNETQLNAKVNDGMTLREFALRQPDCSLTQCANCGLHLWHVSDSGIPRLRTILIGSPALLS